MAGRMAFVWCAVLAVPVAAHHSFWAEYDVKKPVIIKGVVVKVEFLNPHAYFYVDATGETGGVAHWTLETAAPSVLINSRNWDRNAVKVGDQVVVSGYRAKDGSYLASAGKFVLADGRELISADNWGYPGIVNPPSKPGQ